jgi:hypothetical protein
MNERQIVKFVPKSQREKARDIREKEREEKRNKIEFDLQHIVEIENLSETCDILRHHHEQLIEDPDRLSTGFMLKLIKSNEGQIG